MSKTDFAIEFINVSKKFGNFYANKKINIQIKKNSIHAIIGENGAGKSTLMSTLFGIYTPDEGIIKINGDNSFITNPTIASEFGIGMVHQHFKLVDAYTNLQNIVLGNEHSKFGLIDWKLAISKIRSLQEKYSLFFDLNEKTGKTSVAVKQKIEILKVLYRDSDILIFDEPTAILNPQEIEAFLENLKFFASTGKTIIFISHKLNEIKKVADVATVLRHGEVVANFENLDNISVEDLSIAMVGEKVVNAINIDNLTKDEVGVEISNLSATHTKKIENISFQINKGEIVAIAGVEGNGQEELELAISGIIKSKSGKILVNTNKIQPTKWAKFIKNNKKTDIQRVTNYKIDIAQLQPKNRIPYLSYIPGDRHKYGVILDMDNLDNSIIRNLHNPKFVSKTFLRKNSIKSFYKKIVENFDVRGDQEGTKNIRLLSGGNQQKAVVGREIFSEHDFLLVVQPTRGLDVGAIKLIHQAILKEKEQGKSILLISYELDEVLALADSIIVINKGKISQKFLRKDIDRQKIGLLMGGIHSEIKQSN
ncbi:ABC transporter ATP-binding protein [Mesomycoplasma bovoculi]|uniref:Putative sugar ABC transporter ATP-binding protein n=1 Tax=Mesomycoplasma bovoculi M165/69 TaxID=743966 RepID=W5USF7_9BACT|nr:ABC transporter ATP-binding protein [Mesomycoplasma bovoculi]AHH45026.1 putative sugar ABC transporter ATP-binding protein [Mesomycoplasma bovoculi M165/69]